MERVGTGYRRSSGVAAVPGFRFAAVAALGILLLAGSYLAAVQTTTGQMWENAALRGADHVRNARLAAFTASLSGGATMSLFVGSALVVLLALVRRRIDLAVAASGVILLAHLMTQGLKRYILPRPLLVSFVRDHSPNSFPSGHTTAAMAVLMAAVIVVPYRWRDLTVFVALTSAWGMGAYTLTNRWHRVSDVIGAGAIALISACLVSWWLARRGSIERQPVSARPGRVFLIGVLTALSLLALGAGAILWGVPILEGATMSQPQSRMDFRAYLGAHALAAAFPGLITLTFMAAWRRLGT